MSSKAAKCKFQFHALSSSFKFYDGLLDTRKASCEIPMKEKKTMLTNLDSKGK